MPLNHQPTFPGPVGLSVEKPQEHDFQTAQHLTKWVVK